MRFGLVYNAKLPATNYGGVERMTLWLARELILNGHSVVVFAKNGSQLDFCETVGMPDDWRPWVTRNIKNFQLDFVHFQEPFHSDPGLPYLVTIYGNAQKGEVFLPNTNFVSKSHARNHGSKVYVYNGVPVQDFKFEAQRDDYYVFMANDRRVKNYKTAVAWAQDTGVHLKLIGIQGRNQNGIEYLGPLGEKSGKLEVLSKAKAMICPYNWEEPFALAPLEALASGCALISSANGSLPEVTHPHVGVVCDTYSDLLKAPQQIQPINPLVCREFVATQFSMEKSFAGYWDLYQRILKGDVLGPAPFYNFQEQSTKWLYKPTVWNKLKFKALHKI